MSSWIPAYDARDDTFKWIKGGLSIGGIVSFETPDDNPPVLRAMDFVNKNDPVRIQILGPNVSE